MQFYLIASDNKLLHCFRSADKEKKMDIIQFRSEDNAFKKAMLNSSALLLVQKTVDEIPAFIEKMPSLNLYFFEGRLFIYVPDLPKVSANLGTEIRFALLQSGITAVFGSIREINMQHF